MYFKKKNVNDRPKVQEREPYYMGGGAELEIANYPVKAWQEFSYQSFKDKDVLIVHCIFTWEEYDKFQDMLKLHHNPGASFKIGDRYISFLGPVTWTKILTPCLSDIVKLEICVENFDR